MLARSLASIRALLGALSLAFVLSTTGTAHAFPIEVTVTIQRVRGCCDNLSGGDAFFKYKIPSLGISTNNGEVFDGLEDAAWHTINETQTFALDTTSGTVALVLEQHDEDGFLNFADNRIDITQGPGDTVVIDLNLARLTWVGNNGSFCDGPLDAFGGCTAGKTQGPNDPFPAVDDNGGLEWTITFAACGQALVDADASGFPDSWEEVGVDADCDGNADVDVCNAPWLDGDGDGFPDHHEQDGVDTDCDGTPDRDVCGVAWNDGDGDALLDEWEINGVDTDCDGTIDVPIHTYGADPDHKDLFIEYDYCTTMKVSRNEIQNVKAAFAAAPIDVGGTPNPDGQPGVNLWLDTGALIDPLADEGVSSCADGLDNDGNGTADGLDPACMGRLWEGYGLCTDGADNDNDGFADSADTDCTGSSTIEGAPPCADGVDNDSSGGIDGADADCLVGDNLGGGNAITCPLEGIPNLAYDNCDLTDPLNVCVATGVFAGTCTVDLMPCSPNNLFYSFAKANNFDAARAWVFRYGLKHPPADGNAREDGGPPGSCSDGMNNEEGVTPNGADQADPVCAAASEDGVASACFNGTDDQADGDVDSADSDCQAGAETGFGAGTCSDGIDNGDGIDRADPQCAAMREDGSTNPNSCFDGVDQTPFFGDGADAADPNCQAAEDPPLAGRCYDGLDNMADGLIDCADPQCRNRVEQEDGSTAPAGGPTTCCDFVDNSVDGVDGADNECVAVSEDGAGPGSCYDGKDNLTDGIDGRDDDCNFGGGWGNTSFIVYNPDPGGGTLMHEIGHTLGLGHGGNVGNNCKPNYVSVMNYDHQFGIPQQPGRAAEGSLAGVAEDGAAAGSCTDGADNGGGDGIDVMDPDCQTCLDTLDNDGDGRADANDPDCLGIEGDGNATPDRRSIDYSPPRFAGGRATLALYPALVETALGEPGALFSIDPNRDGVQDLPTDPANLIIYKPFDALFGQEGAAGGSATCVDGLDNNGDGMIDALDQGCVAAVKTSPVHGLDLDGDNILDGIDWNNDGDALDVGVTANLDTANPSNNRPGACSEGRFLTGVGENVIGPCSNTTDDDGDGFADASDADCQHNTFDDWTNLQFAPGERAGVPGDNVPMEREPTDQDLESAARAVMAVDLVLTTSVDRVAANASGRIVFAISVENISPTPAFGPVRMEFTGLPPSAQVAAPDAECFTTPEATVCELGWLLGGDVWELDVEFTAHPCEWSAGAVLVSAYDQAGNELNPEDNEAEVEIGAGWTMFRHCSTHSGASGTVGPQTDALDWSYSVGGDVRSSPAIDEDGTAYFGADDNRIHAVRANGTLKWSTQTGGDVRSSPALSADGHLYVGSEDNKLYKVNIANGAVVWTYTTGGDVMTSPVIDTQGNVYFGAGDDKVYALTPNKVVLWTYSTSGDIDSSPALSADGATVYAGSDDDFLYALRTQPGLTAQQRLRWKTDLLGLDVESSPAVGPGPDFNVYVGSEADALFALRPSDGQILWYVETNPDLDVDSSPAVGPNGTIYYGGNDNKVYAVNPQGQTLWTYTTSGDVVSSPAIGADGVIYVGSDDGYVYALLPAPALTPAQRLLWRRSLSGTVRSSPAIGGDGALYVGSDANRLYRIAP